jgi:hypothetical protein
MQENNTPTAIGQAIRILTDFFPGATLLWSSSSQTVRCYALKPKAGSNWSLNVVLLNKANAVTQQVGPLSSCETLPAVLLQSFHLPFSLCPSAPLFVGAWAYTVAVCKLVFQRMQVQMVRVIHRSRAVRRHHVAVTTGACSHAVDCDSIDRCYIIPAT